jgi:hypothetical protein
MQILNYEEKRHVNIIFILYYWCCYSKNTNANNVNTYDSKFILFFVAMYV